MSIDLIKKREKMITTVCLEKNIDTSSEVIVNFIIDVSSSIRRKFANGEIQTIVEKMFPIASTLGKQDKMKELGSYIFSNNFKELTPITFKNYEGYVQVNIINKGYVGGGTNYAPVIKHIAKKYKGTKVPVFNIYITDGENFDPTETKDIIKQSSGEKIFWQFVGIGRSTFNFLQTLQEMTGRINQNTSLFSVNDLANMDDKKLYNTLLDVFSKFLKNFKQGDGTASFTSYSSSPSRPTPPTPPTRPFNTPPKKKGWLSKIVDTISDLF